LLGFVVRSRYWNLPRRWAMASFYVIAFLLFSSVSQISAVAGEQLYEDVQLYLDLGQADKAMLSIRKIKDQQSDSLYHYYLGRITSMLMRNKESIKHFQKAIQLDPKYAKSFASMALVQGRMGDFQSAIKNLDLAISIEPGYAKAYSNRGVTRGALQQNQAALSDFNQSIRLNPRLADAYRNRGITREMVGDLKGACADWKIAGALGQDGPKQWFAAQCK